MRIRLLVRELTLFLALLSAALSMGQDVGPLLLEKEIALPGVEGRIDHFSVDVPGQRLFIAALENGSVEIIDTRQGERTAEIKGLEEPQGVYYSSKTGGLYVATGGDGKLRIYDGKLLSVREILGFGSDADNVRYDEQTGEICRNTRFEKQSSIYLNRMSKVDALRKAKMNALKKAGCTKVYTEIMGGTRTERPILGKLLESLRTGDVLVVWKLDRLGRSLKHLIEGRNDHARYQ